MAEPATGVRIDDALEPVPWRVVGAVCGAVVLALLLVARRYGWHRDELYFLEAGRHHLAWGYMDQPPLTPFIARLADGVARDNLVVLRTVPALTSAATILFGTLLAREMGARRLGQIAATVAMAGGGFAIGVGHILSTAAFDLTAWMALLWLAARLLRTGDPRWWLAFGGVAGVSMLNKNLLVLLAFALLVGFVVERRWDLLLSPWLLAGAALALLIAAPNLIWQSQHGWPQLEMARALSRRIGGENRATLIPLQLLFAGPTLVPVIWWGVRWLGRSPAARPFRPLLWAWPAGIAATFATGGRPYYVLPLTTVVLLAGVVDRAARGQGRLLAWLLGVGMVGTIALALPVLPVSSVKVTGAVNEAVAETVGWPQLVDQVAGVVRSLPPAEQHSVVLLTLTYGEAGAIDRFGPARGLPHAYSGHNSYADFRRPTDPHATVVAVRYSVSELERWFRDCRQVATVDNGLDIDNEVQGEPIVVCRGLRTAWPQTWEQLRFLS
jgi:4-amino-4-deoxy-L-arabinose transferase-like glycosyltransferase